MYYPDRDGKRIRESTFTQDWQEAKGSMPATTVLDSVRNKEQLELGEWVNFFLENYSKAIHLRDAAECRRRCGRIGSHSC